jgi:molecular chaperone GrpE
MDPNKESENTDFTFDLVDEETTAENDSVEDFIRELEAKEKDLHITAETSFIEIAADFEDEDDIPEFMRQELINGPKTPLKPAAPAAPAPAADMGAVKKIEAELAALKSKVAGLEEERKEIFKDSQRRLKDFDAYKARTERERSETFQKQLSNLATQMLPALDNLDRALQYTPDPSDDSHGEFGHFYDGIVLVNQQVNEVLAGMGIVPILTVGEQFDPHFHEAVAVDEESDLPENTITAELLRGFRIGDKVIRHSMVKVSKASGDGGSKPGVSGAGAETDTELSTPAESGSAETEEVSSGGDDEAEIEFVIERNGEDAG